MQTPVPTAALTRLFSELVDGPHGLNEAFMLNSGDVGLLRSLDRLSAASASRSVNGGATIAAHAQHLRYGLSLMNRWAAEGGDPFADARWDEPWKTSDVDAAGWDEIRNGLREEAHRWLQTLGSFREAVDVEVTGMVASIAHLAYHLGAIRQIDKNLFVDVVSMDRQIEDNVFFQRLLATLAGVFGLLALLLASIGLYGMMAYSVARRSNEVGIRMALGADRRRIVGAVAREMMTLVGAGVVVGMGAAWAATRLIAGTLFGLSAMDPPTLAFAIAVMTVVALAAGYVPARRAAAVDPIVSLRQE